MKHKAPSGISGVTLTELVVAMAVMSILASVAMPMYKATVLKTKEIELKRALREMRDAIDEYKLYVDEGRVAKETDSGYPPDLDVLVDGVDVVNTSPMPVKTSQPPPSGGTTPLTTGKLPDRIRFLRRIPVDPMTGEAEWGMRSNQDDPESSTWGGQDVFDVFSLSDKVSLDGETRYEEW